ncbi:MAG TPA: protein-L-isoaspartate(D-aspartate) O-methyltransferase [Gammaproteobacteria bacterium]
MPPVPFGWSALRAPRLRLRNLVPLLGALLNAGTAGAQDDYADQRDRLVREIERGVRETARFTGRDRLDADVLDALRRVPRHEFVPQDLRPYAYTDRPLPIGYDQTISQPYIVAIMTDLAAVDADSVVLEIGTGSGYQAAVLAELAAHVYTIEIVEPLGRRAAETLERLGYDNVTVRIGDGYAGWPEHAPFDAIVVTAAPEEVPRPLIEQLRPGGRMVIPVGEPGAGQTLQVLTKTASGEIERTDVLPVAFVPFTRE